MLVDIKVEAIISFNAVLNWERETSFITHEHKWERVEFPITYESITNVKNKIIAAYKENEFYADVTFIELTGMEINPISFQI